MSEEQSSPDGIPARVRRLVETFVETDLLSIRIERNGESIELGRPAVKRAAGPEAEAVVAEEAPPGRVDTIKADLVGILHMSRPAPSAGDLLTSERELAYVEALGIRNPVRSLGSGRIVAVLCADGEAVDYGRPLFQVDRG